MCLEWRLEEEEDIHSHTINHLILFVSLLTILSNVNFLMDFDSEGEKREPITPSGALVPKSILYSPTLYGIRGLPFWSFIKVRDHLLCALSAPWMKSRHVLYGSIPTSPSLHLFCPFEQPMGHNGCLTLLQGAWPLCFQSSFTLKNTCTSCCSGVIVEILTIHQITSYLDFFGSNPFYQWKVSKPFIKGNSTFQPILLLQEE